MKSDWNIRNNALCRKLTFSDFRTAFAFMQKVADKCEELNHHPDWRNCYNTVEIMLCTHDAGDVITEKDYLLAEAIDLIYNGLEIQ